ncbi:Spore germination protein B1 [Paenibacillus solanacearum]|uniref:Spore germination protein B1 n=1 Tax=Paenibacillus solanacearum TaxID=2048548 RepID=A0A916K491_9BACL|nr:spore germination protein [Paenibacillus solanacearum]CAG7627720.1 Spore germination protein B1 [Paenibacillus solanacearum]
MTTTTSPDVQQRMKERFRHASDFHCAPVHSGTTHFELMYLTSLCDENKLQGSLLRPCFESGSETSLAAYLASHPDCSVAASEQEAMDGILSGCALISLNGQLLLLDIASTINSQANTTTIETTLQGPQLALTENLKTNMLMIRSRYPSSDLVVQELTVGTLSKTKLIIVYDQTLADPAVLKEIRERLSCLKARVITAVAQLQILLSPPRRSLLPTMMTTERPDRIALNLSQGKVIFLLDGTPFSMIVPAVFYDFFSSMDDQYQPFWVARPFLWLRFIALFITLTAPALYVAVVSYNPEFFRVQLTLSIAGSRAAVPYPSYMEVIFMMFMTEALTEASLRLPKYIGSTATTVGGLILGQAAQQAGLVSSIMIIISAAVAISNFVIPISPMSLAVRIAKYPLILLASLSGLVGIMLGLLTYTIVLSDLRSFGKPYFKVFVNERENGLKRGGRFE